MIGFLKIATGGFFSLMYLAIFWVAAAYWLPWVAPHRGESELNAFRGFVFFMLPVYMWGPGRDLMGEPAERFVKLMNIVIFVTIAAYVWATGDDPVMPS